MRQVLVERPGGHDRLRLVAAPDPEPGPGEVLVDVETIGVNYADCVVRMGLYASARKYVGWPITPGFEVAGKVGAVGEGVTDLAPGERVFAVTRFGGYATKLVVPRNQVFALPHGFGVAEAAGFSVMFLTAHHALFGLARPRPGDTLLVHSAAGGVGSALCQLGKSAGCRVVGVVGAPHKIDAAHRNGADVVIDKSTSDLWVEARRQAESGFAAVFDANGVTTLRRSYQHLQPTGSLVVYGFHSMLPRHGGRPRWSKLVWDYLRTPRFSPLELTAANKSVHGFNLSYLFDRDDLLAETMGDLLARARAGVIRPSTVTTYPFERVADAHRDLESGQTVGKLVLDARRPLDG
jgi:NADPH:quinone reductase-like Zn-dependent oxidoreductase